MGKPVLFKENKEILSENKEFIFTEVSM